MSALDSTSTVNQPAQRSYAVMRQSYDKNKEPNFELACNWWSENTNAWTPIGWKEHLFRFNIIYNGTIIAEPNPYVHADDTTKKSTVKYAGQGVQLTFIPQGDESIPEYPQDKFYLCRALLPRGGTPKAMDKGIGDQGWNYDHETPLLWSRWKNAGSAHGKRSPGVILRHQVFAHIAGAEDIKTRIEPIFCWIRMYIEHVDELMAPERYGFMIKINAPHIRTFMDEKINMEVVPEDSLYPRKLEAKVTTPPPYAEISGKGLILIEPDEKIRLGILPTDKAKIKFIDNTEKSKDYFLYVEMPCEKGVYIDMLLPMLPTDKYTFNAEANIGYDEALKQSDRYWSKRPEMAAVVETPEDYVNKAVKYSIKMAEYITERNPDTGYYTFINGSWHYDVLWPTPTTMPANMMLDPFGYHDCVGKHIGLYRHEQGTIVPPGPTYQLHPGYFASPKSLTAYDWLADNGAILYSACFHALISDDKKFIDDWLEPIIKSCEWIKEVRSNTDHSGVPGVLPPAVATDQLIPTQAVWNSAWNYKGLITAVRLLKKLNHPRAEEFEREAIETKEVFVKTLREATEKMPRWTDDEGNKRYIAPSSFTSELDIHDVFFLDSGALVCVWAGLVDADDPIMEDLVAYFRYGPNTKLYDPRENYWQRPCLIHEIASCEPCYSWNVFHSHQKGDRYRYLECMYSLIAGGICRQTFSGVEIRNGVFATLFSNSLFMYLIRLAVVDDTLAEDQLHLLRFVPLAWLRSEMQTRFEKMPTMFGPVSLKFRLSDAQDKLEIAFENNFKNQPEKVLLHVPPVPGLKSVVINNKEIKTEPFEMLKIEF